MAQSRIEELEAQIDELNRIVSKKSSAISELLDKIEILQDEQPNFESYQICHQEVRLELEESTIQMEDFFERLSEKSKQYAGFNQFIEAIEKL